MAVISILQTLIETGCSYQNEIWYTSKSKESPLNKLINRANSHIKVVTGELDPKEFEREDVLNSFRTFFEKGDTRVDMAFYKQVGTNEEIVHKLAVENKKLVELKNKYSKKLHLYHLKARPSHHYAIADNKHLLLEEPYHAPYAPRRALIRFNDPKLVREWDLHFNKLISGISEI